jgi:hypothetical protein
VIELAASSLAVVALAFFLGVGLAGLVLPERFRPYLAYVAPWIGWIQASIVLTLFASFGVGVRRAWPAPLVVAALLLVVAGVRRRPRVDAAALRRALVPVVFAVLTVAILLAPTVKQFKHVTTFTLFNHDPFSYVLAARHVIDHGLFPLPDGRATADHNIRIQLEYNPRWLPILTLALPSVVLGVDPVRVFSVLQTVAFGFQLSLVWLLGRSVFGLTGTALLLGVLLAALNPYATYIALHGFMPQVLGTGYLLAFLACLAGALETPPAAGAAPRVPDREVACLVLLGTGILTSYLELVPFAMAILFGYAAWTAWRHGLWGRRLGAALAVGVAMAALNPFHVVRIVDFLWSHVQAVAPDSPFRSGWPMPASYREMAGLLVTDVPLLSAVLAPAVAGLGVVGLAAAPRRPFLLLVAAPFAGAALLAYRAEYSYAFFKSMTYVYFWLPLVVASGVAAVLDRARARGRGGRPWPAVAAAAVLAAAALLATEAIQTNELRRNFGSRKTVRDVPPLAGLERFNRDPRVDDVYVQGLDGWEALWAIYYLRAKSVGMSGVNGYVNNRAGVATDGTWRYVLRREGYRTLLGDGERPLEEILLRSGPYVFGRLAPAPHRDLGSLALGRGFHLVDSDGREESVWAQRAAEILVDWPGRAPAALVTLEIWSAYPQAVAVALDGTPLCSLGVEAGVRQTFDIALQMPAGRHRLSLTGDREAPRWAPDDPRPLSLRLFAIGLDGTGEVPAASRCGPAPATR